MSRPPLPPFTAETAAQKVQAAEDAWNTRDPRAGRRWPTRRTRCGATATRSSPAARRSSRFLTSKWERELDYALRKDLWAFEDDRIAVRFQYECHDDDGQWWRSYGNELWEFDADGLMRRREASINDVAIDESERRIFGARERRGARHRAAALLSCAAPASRCWVPITRSRSSVSAAGVPGRGGVDDQQLVGVGDVQGVALQASATPASGCTQRLGVAAPGAGLGRSHSSRNSAEPAWRSASRRCRPGSSG